eukprot:gnl/MRDRNA2_/MRDRNA2_77862_c0_seq1.p1 gnl/MRDRNA2_/MRDRNA2_77862_c0~~gnl/MRDRNA2_/MRDRNA2_77862_c0_seq1.p1  ORF type:complete len:566 (+),score=68.70 gnl/MRDRNA2_/MRDRNA2_77862_c0_seq1:123-1820(+)
MSQIVPVETTSDSVKDPSNKGVPEGWMDKAESQNNADSIRSRRSRRSLMLEKVNANGVKWRLVLLSSLSTVMNVFLLRLFFGVSTWFAALLFGLAGVLKPYMHLLPWSMAYPDHLTTGQFRNFTAALSVAYVIFTALRYLTWPEDNPAFEAKVTTEEWEEARSNAASSVCAGLQVFIALQGMMWLPTLVYRRAVTERHSTCLYGAGLLNSVFASSIAYLDFAGIAHLYSIGILGMLPWLFYLYWDKGKNISKDWGYLHMLSYWSHVLPIGLGATTFSLMTALKGSGVGQLIVFVWYHLAMMLFIEMMIVTAKRAVDKDPRKYIPVIFPFVFAYDVFGDFCFLGAPLDSWYFWVMVVFEILIVVFHDSGFINDIALCLTCSQRKGLSTKEKLDLLHEQLACAELYTTCELWGILTLLIGVLSEFVFEACGLGTHSLLAYVEETQKGRLKILLKYFILAIVIALACMAGHKILIHKIKKAISSLKETSKDLNQKCSDEIETEAPVIRVASKDSMTSLECAEHEHHKTELMWKENFLFFLAVVLYEGCVAFWNVAFVNWKRKWLLTGE